MDNNERTNAPSVRPSVSFIRSVGHHANAPATHVPCVPRPAAYHTAYRLQPIADRRPRLLSARLFSYPPFATRCTVGLLTLPTNERMNE